MLDGLGEADAPRVVRVVLVTVVVLGGAWAVLVRPPLRARRWRWALSDEELDLRHGALVEVRTIVPIARVQHVEMRRSVLAQLLGTADVIVHTAAGRTRIPALQEDDAIVVRERIAVLARVPDDL